MSCNIAENRNFFLKLKPKLGLYHVVLATTQNSVEKISMTVVEVQQMPKSEKIDCRIAIACPNCTIYNGRRKMCMKYKTNSDKLNGAINHYRNSIYLKGVEMEQKLTEYEKLFSKRKYLLSYIDKFFKRCFLLDGTTIHIWIRFHQKNGCLHFSKHYPTLV